MISAMRLMIPVLLGGLAACTPLPDLDLPLDPVAGRDSASIPGLVPLDGLLALAAAQEDAAAGGGPRDTAAPAARMTALNARAARLRKATVIDAPSRARLLRGVAVPALQ